MDLMSEIRASALRARRDPGAEASSKNSIAGKIRRNRSGQVCKPVIWLFRGKSIHIPLEINSELNYPLSRVTHCHEFETSIYYENNTKCGLGSKKCKNTDVNSKRFETQDTILVELRVLSNNNLSRLADRLNV